MSFVEDTTRANQRARVERNQPRGKPKEDGRPCGDVNARPAGWESNGAVEEVSATGLLGPNSLGNLTV
jgi:hypothetical protein